MIERALQLRTLSIRTTATRHSDVTVGIVTVAAPEIPIDKKASIT